MSDIEVADPLDTMLGDEAAEEPTEVSEVEEQPEESDQPRDEQGRYAARDEDQPTDEAQAEVEPATGDAPETPEEVEVPASPRTFSYNADYQPWEIQGSEVQEDGAVHFSKEALPEIQQLFAAGKHHLGNWQKQRQESQQQVQASQAEASSQRQRADSIVAQFDELLRKPDEELFEAVQGFKQQWPAVKAQAEQQATVARHEQERHELAQYKAQEYARQITPALRQGLAGDTVRLHREKYSNLSDEDVSAVYENMWNNRANSNLFVVQNGQFYTDTSIVEQHLAYASRLKGEQQQQEARTSEAKEKNKAEVGGNKNTPPPHVSTKSGPAPTGKVTEKREFKSTEDVDEWFDDEDFDV